MSSPVQSLLEHGASTAIVNFVTWNKAYSIFPLCTCIHRKSYVLQCRHTSSTTMPWLSRHGWKIQEVMWPEEQRSNHPIRHDRRIGDRFSWVIPLDISQVEWPKKPDFVVETACFSISAERYSPPRPSLCREIGDGVESMSYTITTRPFTSKCLKYTYLPSSIAMGEFLRRRADVATLMELKMLDPSVRPRNYPRLTHNTRNLDRSLEDFQPPATWRYWDDEFPSWQLAWESTQYNV